MDISPKPNSKAFDVRVTPQEAAFIEDLTKRHDKDVSRLAHMGVGRWLNVVNPSKIPHDVPMDYLCRRQSSLQNESPKTAAVIDINFTAEQLDVIRELATLALHTAQDDASHIDQSFDLSNLRVPDAYQEHDDSILRSMEFLDRLTEIATASHIVGSISSALPLK